MLKIKSFKLFLESLNARIGKANFTNRRDESILSQIELYKVSNNIFCVVIVDPRLRTHLFMRYAEHQMRILEIRNSVLMNILTGIRRKEILNYSVINSIGLDLIYHQHQ